MIYFIIDNKRIKCKEINENVTSTLYVKIFIKFKNNRDYFEIVIGEIYIIFEFFYDMIIEIKIIKFN